MHSKLPLLSEYLDVELLSRLPNLEVRARFLVSGFLAGLHKSPFKGSSVEFKEFRDYQPGDEFKLIDWTVYARTDRLHVRLREEETNMTVYLLLDKSASMNYHTPKGAMSKWEYAKSLVAAFLLFLNSQRDAVSLSFIGHSLENFSKGSSRSSHFHRMMVSLHCDADADESNISKSLEEVATHIKNRSIVMVFSDFYEDPEKMETAMGHLRHLNCEVIFFHILDPQEVDFDFDDTMLLQEMESLEQLSLSPALIRSDYRKKIEEHIDTVKALALKYNGEYLLMRTDESPIQALGAYLNLRRGKQ